MSPLLLLIEYEGTNYHGWQIQFKLNTVQAEIEKALEIIFKKKVKTSIASRTDTGVHAEGQIVEIIPPFLLPLFKLKKQLNALTPLDIAIIDIAPNHTGLKLRYLVHKKRYRYQICNNDSPKALQRQFYWLIRQILSIPSMQEASQNLIGSHDFAAFRSKGCIQPTQKTIYSIDISNFFNNNVRHIHISFEGSGFLRHMVRIIMGSLVDIGLKKQPTSLFHNVLASGKRIDLGKTAPAKGLFLEKIILNPNPFTQKSQS